MTVLKNSLRPNGNKQHDLGRDGIRWNKLWVGDINSNGDIYNNNAILSQTYAFETTYGAQIEFQSLLYEIFTPPEPGTITNENPILVKMPNIIVAAAPQNPFLSYQFRLVVNGIEIPPSKTQLAIVETDTFIKFDGKIFGQLIDIDDSNEVNTAIVVWYVPDLSV